MPCDEFHSNHLGDEKILRAADLQSADRSGALNLQAVPSLGDRASDMESGRGRLGGGWAAGMLLVMEPMGGREAVLKVLKEPAGKRR
jgi:hypothetical protein